MAPELITMFTHHDSTVEDACELFATVADVPVKHFGFKDVGLVTAKMEKLHDSMKVAGKTTYLEVVSLSEEAGLRGAKLAVEIGVDVLMGTVFFDSINEYLAGKRVQYYPFPGHVHGHPTILDGTIDEIVDHARTLESNGVPGMDLLTYRYVGDAPALLSAIVAATSVPVVSAGGIDSFEKISAVRDLGAWGFTIGSAFFENAFVPDGCFRDNVMAVYRWLKENGLPQQARELGGGRAERS